MESTPSCTTADTKYGGPCLSFLVRGDVLWLQSTLRVLYSPSPPTSRTLKMEISNHLLPPPSPPPPPPPRLLCGVVLLEERDHGKLHFGVQSIVLRRHEYVDPAWERRNAIVVWRSLISPAAGLDVGYKKKHQDNVFVTAPP